MSVWAHPKEYLWQVQGLGDDEDMTSMHMSKHGEWCEDEGDLQGFSSRQSLSSSSPQGGGPKQLKFESPLGSRSSPH